MCCYLVRHTPCSFVRDSIRLIWLLIDTAILKGIREQCSTANDSFHGSRFVVEHSWLFSPARDSLAVPPAPGGNIY